MHFEFSFVQKIGGGLDPFFQRRSSKLAQMRNESGSSAGSGRWQTCQVEEVEVVFEILENQGELASSKLVGQGFA